MQKSTEHTVAVVAVDFLSKTPRAPVEAACGLLMFAPDPQMHLINVRQVPAGPSGPVDPGQGPENRVMVDIDRELGALDDLGANVTAGTRVRAVSHVRVGDEAREIVALAQGLHADLIVLGRHERGGAKLLLHGPEDVEADVRRAAPCPVFVVEPEAPTRRSDEERPAWSPEEAPRPPPR
jgi:nucleotide-binding universal stress UspA family protein